VSEPSEGGRSCQKIWSKSQVALAHVITCAMTATTTPHSAPTPGQADDLLELATRLYARVSSGHDGLAYNVDAQGAALTVLGADGKRRPVTRPTLGAPAWQRARELREGVEADRRLNPWVLQQHLRGRYSIAPAAPGWVEWVALDIDAHPVPGAPELVARRLAKERADRVLAEVWRALGCSAERHPLVLRSPGGGYHVWFPLTRGATSANPEHTWPAAVARAWFERHLTAAGLELGPGVLEVFPSGRCLRAPCGRGMVMLQATRPGEPDALGLVPWPGTLADARVDWLGKRAELSTPVRRVAAMVRTFLAQWDAQRRTLADWLGRPEASWDPTWGFLGWRTEVEDEAAPAAMASEKKLTAASLVVPDSSQELVDVPGCLGRQDAGGEGAGYERGALRKGRVASPVRSKESITSSAQGGDVPPERAGDPGVRGRAFKEKVQRLLAQGVIEPGTRHDAVLTLAFYWAATCGLGEVGALSRLDAWCKAHPHGGSRLAARPRVFRDTCIREAAHYITHHSSRWRFQGKGDGGGLGTLMPADQVVVSSADARVKGEVAAILAWLAGHADGEGRIGEPVQIATGLLARLCGDRRVDDDGKRRRTTTLAMIELERLGVLTLAREYRVGHRGREWSCWYRFGSGELPRTMEVSPSVWAAIGSATARSQEVAARQEGEGQEAPESQGALVRVAVEGEPVVGGTLAAEGGIVATEGAVVVALAPAPVTVRVLGEREVPEGLLQVLSDGLRGAPRTLLALAKDIGQPTAHAESREPWFMRMFQRRAFTPAELLVADAAKVVPMPDLTARRRMTRRERLAASQAPAAVIPLRAPPAEILVPRAPVVTPQVMTASVTALAPELALATDPRAELGAEIGADAAAELPLDLAEIAAYAWRAFRRIRES